MPQGSGPVALLLACTVALAACGDDPAGPSGDDGGVDLEALFAAPTAADVAAVEAEWAARDPVAADVQVELTETLELSGIEARLRVISHDVDGVLHYAGVLDPVGADAGSLPVLVYAHGGDAGVDLDEVTALGDALGDRADDFVWVVPSFRSEPLEYGGEVYLSGGEASPWDRDVDDALAAVASAVSLTPSADPDRVGVLGFSRGGGVALLMAVRDPGIDLVVDFFGPTDFFAPSVREIVEEALDDEPRDLPGLDILDERFLQPLADGELTEAEVRRELVRRSAVLWADALPDVQVHHGTADDVVDVDQAESLSAALDAAGREPPSAEVFLYQGGGHNPLTLFGSIPRTLEFLDRLAG